MANLVKEENLLGYLTFKVKAKVLLWRALRKMLGCPTSPHR